MGNIPTVLYYEDKMSFTTANPSKLLGYLQSTPPESSRQKRKTKETIYSVLYSSYLHEYGLFLGLRGSCRMTCVCMRTRLTTIHPQLVSLPMDSLLEKAFEQKGRSSRRHRKIYPYSRTDPAPLRQSPSNEDMLVVFRCELFICF